MKARKTIYNGIQMRSRLEAGFASWLDSYDNVDWEYEPYAIASAEGQYLPDFLLRGLPVLDLAGKHSVDVYVEVKPPSVWDGYDAWDLDAVGPAAKLEAQARIVAKNYPKALFVVASPLPIGGHGYDPQGLMTWRSVRRDRDPSGPFVATPKYVWVQQIVGGSMCLGLCVRQMDPSSQPWADNYWEPS